MHCQITDTLYLTSKTNYVLENIKLRQSKLGHLKQKLRIGEQSRLGYIQRDTSKCEDKEAKGSLCFVIPYESKSLLKVLKATSIVSVHSAS